MREFDAFDLPDWLGVDPVCWQADSALTGGPHVTGHLTAHSDAQPLDLLAVDAAYPTVSCPETHRRTAHQAWQLGELALVEVDSRVAAAVPGTGFDANLVCEVVRRLAKAVGADPAQFTVSIALSAATQVSSAP
ncbi:MAG: hypothetical protein ACRDQA_15800 [Nocardioidaceae bacterium]